MNKISVIIPAFNSQTTIEQCIQSIISQSFNDLEIILIDDGSQDDTLSRMERLQSSDDRIRILTNAHNMGAGYSRNRGLSIASGNYITFVDSDDYIDYKTYDSVNTTISNYNNPDIVRYKQDTFLDLGKIHINLNFFTTNIFNNTKGIITPSKQQYYVALESPGACNKVFKRELIDDIKFTSSKWEDYPFSTPLFGKAKQVAFAPEGKQYYRHFLNFNNTTLGDIKKISSNILDIYNCCDIVEARYRKLGLFEQYKKSYKIKSKNTIFTKS